MVGGFNVRQLAVLGAIALLLAALLLTAALSALGQILFMSDYPLWRNRPARPPKSSCFAMRENSTVRGEGSFTARS
jgi:hypothetical protein